MKLRHILTVALYAALAGCVPDDRAPVPAENAADTGYQIPVSQTLFEEGRQTYNDYCIGCHGEKGDGAGAAAWALHPPPRDFTQAKFKFSSRRGGELPTDQDLFDTITKGLKGTSMPPWRLLPERRRWSLVAYIKTFSDRWQTEFIGPAIPIIEDPYAETTDKSEAFARGEAVYHGLATCWTCHPAYVETDQINKYLELFDSPRREAFREDIHKAVARLSTLGNVVFVPDFKTDFVRAGSDPKVLYRSISAGITGTAMPTWVDSIEISKGDGEFYSTRGDLWALAYYVQSLIEQRPPKLSEGSFALRSYRRMDTLSLPWKPAVIAQLQAVRGGGDEEEEEEEEP